MLDCVKIILDLCARFTFKVKRTSYHGAVAGLKEKPESRNQTKKTVLELSLAIKQDTGLKHNKTARNTQFYNTKCSVPARQLEEAAQAAVQNSGVRTVAADKGSLEASHEASGRDKVDLEASDRDGWQKRKPSKPAIKETWPPATWKP